MKKSLSRLAVAGALGASVLGIGATASAASSVSGPDASIGTRCYGTYETGGHFTEGGKIVGAWFLYYSASNGGTYCAYTKDYKPGKAPMAITVTKTGNKASDRGQFSSYAGTASMRQSVGKCVYFKWEYNGQARTTERCRNTLY